MYDLFGRPEKGGLCVGLKEGGLGGVPVFGVGPVSLVSWVVIPGAEISAVAPPEVTSPGV